MQAQTQRLPIHEWVAVVIIITMLLFFTLQALRHDDPTLTLDHTAVASEPLVEITILGAVKYPGTYQLEKGTTLQEALDHAEPLPNANLKSLKLDSKLVKKRKLTVKAAAVRKRNSKT